MAFPPGGDIGGDIDTLVSIYSGCGCGGIAGAMPAVALRWHRSFSLFHRNLARSLCVLLLADT